MNIRCSAVQKNVDILRSDLFGDCSNSDRNLNSIITAGEISSTAEGATRASGGSRGGGGDGSSGGGSSSLAARLVRAEAAWHQAAVQLELKADASAVQSTVERLEDLQEQVEANRQGVEGLTNATYKRVDEHATAIQRLAEVSGWMGLCRVGKLYIAMSSRVGRARFLTNDNPAVHAHNTGHQQQQRGPPYDDRRETLAVGGSGRGGSCMEGVLWPVRRFCSCGPLQYK